MKAEIINIGDELLIGQVVNTNASWMAEQLTLTGFPVIRVTVISDTRDQILDALKEAEQRSDIVLISGGIGPTNDDITKQTLCEYFNTSLVFDEDAYRDIELFFALRGMKVTPLNRQQAELPAACISLPNKLGTARGMWFEKRDPSGRKVVFVSMPGVPFEMKELMVKEVIPRLKNHFNPPFLYHKTLLTQGIGESFLAEQIARWEENLPENIRLAYLPQPGLVRLRLSGSGDNETTVRRQVTTAAEELQSLIPDYLFGQDDDTLEAIIGRLLTQKGQTLATAESCTGGYIAHLITSVPGSSNYFKGSIVAYANDIKENLLFVSPETILKKGAVSE
ncbi:MAG TPA: CinA family nicotinamide mononucleotide deamidase-related protein, partial [Bacteroidales bacterium]|nr:CinA family nicotinamide mononucleotide deamidase-related protein [Bacteroidales bacterium]